MQRNIISNDANQASKYIYERFCQSARSKDIAKNNSNLWSIYAKAWTVSAAIPSGSPILNSTQVFAHPLCLHPPCDCTTMIWQKLQLISSQYPSGCQHSANLDALWRSPPSPP
jgi:hypothetical protein